MLEQFCALLDYSAYAPLKAHKDFLALTAAEEARG